MYHGSQDFWKKLISQALDEDGWRWDWTTMGALKAPDQKLTARVVAKSDGIWAADGLLKSLPEELDVTGTVKDGQPFTTGQTLLTWRGPGYLILTYERAFLNLAAYSGGIATQTRKLIDELGRIKLKQVPRICSTRKILPLYRDLAIHSVQVGGGHSHRLNLAGGVLIKENHIAAAGGIQAAIVGARNVAPHGMKIEVEVRSQDELKLALQARADGVLLDNFTPEQVQTALNLISTQETHRPLVEISGGLNPTNFTSYAIEGVDVLSFGFLTHSVKALDLSLLVQG